MMGDVTGMISQWLQVVFDICVEGREELALGQKSLLIMREALSVSEALIRGTWTS